MNDIRLKNIPLIVETPECDYQKEINTLYSLIEKYMYVLVYKCFMCLITDENYFKEYLRSVLRTSEIILTISETSLRVYETSLRIYEISLKMYKISLRIFETSLRISLLFSNYLRLVKECVRLVLEYLRLI